MTARISLIPGKARGHRPRLQRLLTSSLLQTVPLPACLECCKRSKFGGGAASDCGEFTSGLEANKVRAVAPGKWSAQPHTGLYGRVVDDIDGSFVIRAALGVAGEVPRSPLAANT